MPEQSFLLSRVNVSSFILLSVKKALSCILALALVSPGAFAAEIVNNAQTGVAPVPGGVVGAQLPGLGALSTPIGNPLSASINPTLKTTLPSIAALNPTVKSVSPSQVLAADRALTPFLRMPSPMARPAPWDAARSRAVIGDAPASGRIHQAMVERAQKAAAAPQGLYNILVDENAPETQSLTLPGQAMESAASSKEWGEKSFSTLRGEAPGYSDAAAVSADSLTPQPSRGMGLLRAGSSQAEPKKKGIPLPAKVAAGAAALFAGVSFLGLDLGSLAAFNPFSFLSGLSWPAWIAVQLGITIVVQLVKSFLKARKARQEKAEKKAAEELASKFHDNADLDAESAGRGVQETLSSGRLAEAKVYDFTLGEFRGVPLSERLLEMIRAGGFHVSTDDTGALYLVPKVSAEKPS